MDKNPSLMFIISKLIFQFKCNECDYNFGNNAINNQHMQYLHEPRHEINLNHHIHYVHKPKFNVCYQQTHFPV